MILNFKNGTFTIENATMDEITEFANMFGNVKVKQKALKEIKAVHNETVKVFGKDMTPHPEEIRNEILKRYKQGEKINDLAKEYNIPYATIYTWTNRYLKRNTSPHSQALKRKILSELSQGKKITELSGENGIPYRTIYGWAKSANMDIKHPSVQKIPYNPIETHFDNISESDWKTYINKELESRNIVKKSFLNDIYDTLNRIYGIVWYQIEKEYRRQYGYATHDKLELLYYLEYDKGNPDYDPNFRGLFEQTINGKLMEMSKGETA